MRERYRRARLNNLMNIVVSPMTHRPYLNTYFPYTAAELAYYRNEILLALQREMEARNVEINPKTGGITKKEKERLMIVSTIIRLGKSEGENRVGHEKG